MNKLKRCNSLEIVSFTAQLNAMLSKYFMRVRGQSSYFKRKVPSIHARTLHLIHNTFRWNVNTIFLNLSNTSLVFFFTSQFFPIPTHQFTIFIPFLFLYFILISLYRLISYKKKSAQIKQRTYSEQGNIK